MPGYEIVDLGFSTADAGYPELQWIRGDIHSSFVDWREQPIRFVASDVLAFSWFDELDLPDIRDDVTYEVLESEIIRKYSAWNIISPGESYRHFKLCFNAVGVFDVVCMSITVT